MVVRALAAALAALALGAVPAHARSAAFACDWTEVLRVDNIESPDDYTGVLYAALVQSAVDPGRLRCYIAVDGAVVAEVSLSETGVAAEAVTFRAADFQDVDLCMEWSDAQGSGTTCGEPAATQIPPQEVIDLVNDVFEVLDPIVMETTCLALNVAYVGVPGVVEIRPGGDIYVLNEPVWDCP